MTSLREALRRGSLVVAPGVGDALGALLVAEAGFEALSISGYQVAATLGYPDVGLVTMTEMVERAARVVEAVEIPVITDADTGYGNAVNVARTVRAFSRAGVAAIHLEDQVSPKKCGAMDGRVLIPADEMVGKIAAALDARERDDLMIIARTDAISAEGIDAALARAGAYRRAGADAVMVMAPRSVDDLVRFRREIEGPLVVTMGSWRFSCSVKDLEAIGYDVVLFPLTTMRRTVTVVREVLRELRARGEVDHGPRAMIPVEELHALLGLGRIRDMEARYAVVRAGRHEG